MGIEQGQVIHFPDRQQEYANNTGLSEFAQVISIDGIRKRREQAVRPSENAGTAAWNRYFDTHYRKEGLNSNWSELTTPDKKHVGFVMKNQMALLENVRDIKSVRNWATKTRRDLEGFKHEFLSDSNVYPRLYVVNPDDPTRLEEPLYGKTKDGRSPDMTEITTDEERNGSVKKSLTQIKEFLLNSPEGSIAVMASPVGPTGFKDQDGRGIDYIDSYFFVMVKQNDSVMNYTVKTDFNLPQCREAVLKLTGKQIEKGAPLEEYVEAVATIKPGDNENINSVFDVIRVLEDIQPEHAFKDKKGNQQTRSWRNVYDDVVKGEELYNFESKTQAVIREFEEYANEGGHTKDDLQKAIAVAILRMSDQFFGSKDAIGSEKILEKGVWHNLKDKNYASFGERLEEASKIRGCSGGGGGISFMSILNPGRRVGGGGGGSKEGFNCPECGYHATGPVGDQCPKTKGGCGLTKQQYASKSGKAMCA
ncbi:MAG TPA: hypothetical protein VM077_00355 [Candidatus Limnocylindrales bacterium]|nr:hypothetical protein [Candidatus Limnocylindrales bacterium]